jgi:hypothetical protein
MMFIKFADEPNQRVNLDLQELRSYRRYTFAVKLPLSLSCKKTKDIGNI